MMRCAFRPPRAMTFATVEKERVRFLAYCRNSEEACLVVDLERVEQCDSAGLAFLIEAMRMSKIQGRHASIVNMPQSIQALAKFYGISELLELK